MALKVSIGGTTYGVRPESLRVTQSLNKRSTSQFTVREPYTSMTRFTKGSPVIIYDDAVDDEVEVSNTYDPYGPPGLIFGWATDGRAECNATPLPSGDLDDGTFEVMIAFNYGVEIIEGILKQVGIYETLFTIAMFDGSHDYLGTFAWVGIGYDTSGGGLRLRMDSAGGTVYSDVGDPVFTDGGPLRFSVTWDYDGATNTTLTLYVNGVSRTSDIFAGRFTGGATPAYVGWYTQPDVHPLVEGYLSDARLWKYARSDTDILGDMYDYLAGTETDLIGYWKCDDGTGTAITDYTSGGYDGVLMTGYTGHYPDWGVALKDWTGTFTGEGTTEYSTFDYRFFAGRVETSKLVKVPPDVYDQNITCLDYSGRFDDLLLSADVQDVNCGEVIKMLFPKALADEEIGVRTVSAGPSIARQRFQFNSLRSAMEELRKASDYCWYVDPYKELRFHPRITKWAPFDISNEDSTLMYLWLKREESASSYYNKLWAKARIRNDDGDEEVVMFVHEDSGEIAARASAEGGSGIYEHYEELPVVRSYEHAQWLVVGMLRDAVASGTTVFYRTRQSGLRPGMLQHIEHTEQDIDGDYLITEVTFFLEGGVDPQYDVVATLARAPGGLDALLTKGIESKSNFRNDVGFYFLIPLGGIGECDGVRIGDSLVITSGAI